MMDKLPSQLLLGKSEYSPKHICVCVAITAWTHTDGWIDG